jgi:hypothetical protein
MFIGEPEIDLNKQPGGKLTVEIKGIDVYDPTTPTVRISTGLGEKQTFGMGEFVLQVEE